MIKYFSTQNEVLHVKRVFLPYIALVFLLNFLSHYSVSAIEVIVERPPGNYRVFSLRGTQLGNPTYARNFSEFTFNIPDNFVKKNRDGKIDLEASLQNWRSNTPIGKEHPRTRKGVGYYPFKDSHGNYHYIALEDIYENHRSHVNYTDPMPVKSTVKPTVRPTVKPTVLPSPQTPATVPVPVPVPTAVPVRTAVPALTPAVNTPNTDFKISLVNPPKTYRVFDLEGNGKLAEHDQNSGNFRSLDFQIPNEYLIRDAKGEVDFRKSLRNWRKLTPVAEGNPRTGSKGIHYYPFMDSSGNWKYIALEHIHDHYPKTVKYAEVEEEISDDSIQLRVKRPKPKASDYAPPASPTPAYASDYASSFTYVQTVDGEGSDELSGSSGNTPHRVPIPVTRPEDLNTCGFLCNDFPPRKATFVPSSTPKKTEGATNAKWVSMSASERAKYIMDHYKRIQEKTQYGCNYSPRILTCKTYRESLFHPQWQTAVKNSSASGLAQITKTTMKDMVNRYNFKSVIPGTTHMRSFTEFWKGQQSNILLQMNLSLGVFDMKRKDMQSKNRKSKNKKSKNKPHCSSIKSILRKYYGNPRQSCNNDYADNIYGCAVCIRDNNNQISKRCLKKSLSKIKGC